MNTTTAKEMKMKSETMTMNANELRKILEDVADDYGAECTRSRNEAEKLNQQNSEWASQAFDHAQAMQRITHQLDTMVQMLYRLGGSGDITITFSK